MPKTNAYWNLRSSRGVITALCTTNEISFEMMKRALRRHHYQRLKRKRRAYYGGYGRHREEAQGKLAATATVCSCWMCGNPRTYFGELTRQETLAALNFTEQQQED